MLNAGVGANTPNIDLVAAGRICRQWVGVARRVINDRHPLHCSKGRTGLVGAERPS